MTKKIYVAKRGIKKEGPIRDLIQFRHPGSFDVIDQDDTDIADNDGDHGQSPEEVLAEKSGVENGLENSIHNLSDPTAKNDFGSFFDGLTKTLTGTFGPDVEVID